jgi:hypothetical protein
VQAPHAHFLESFQGYVHLTQRRAGLGELVGSMAQVIAVVAGGGVKGGHEVVPPEGSGQVTESYRIEVLKIYT